MIKTGYSLLRDGVEVMWMESIPPRLDIPGTDDVVFDAAPGWDNGAYSIVAQAKEFDDAAPLVPRIISDRQFFQILAVNGAITEGEAIAAVATGTIPSAMDTFVQSLPSSEQFAARMLLSGAVEFNRTHPLVETFGAGMGWTGAQIDQIWRDAAML